MNVNPAKRRSAMSMSNTGEGWSRFGSFAGWGNRSRISWGAVLAGAAVAVAASLILDLLGAALGACSISDLQDASARGAGFWTIISLALSMALGGYVASRLSGTHSHLDGELHGITMWAVAVLLSALAFAHLFGGAIEMVGLNAGPAIGSAAGQNGPMISGPNPQRIIDRF